MNHGTYPQPVTCHDICPFAGCDDCPYRAHVPGQMTLDLEET